MKFFDFFSNFLSNHSTVVNPDKETFDHYFFDLKYYLKPSASLEEFSNLLKISVIRVNNISQSHYFLTFDKLIYEHRYIHIMSEFNNPVNANMSLDAIVKLSGYEDGSSFADFIKKRKEKI